MNECCGGLTLERWRDMLGFHPYHFFQLANQKVPVTSACNTLVREYEWQNADAVGRQAIRDAIGVAVERLTEYLDYSPYPRYFEEVIPLRYQHFGFRCVNVRLAHGRFRAFGVEAFTALTTDNLTVSVVDLDGDGLNDAWTATFDGTEYDLETYIYPGDEDLPWLGRATSRNGPDCRWLFQAERYEIDEDAGTVTLFTRLGPAVKPALLGLPTQAGMTALDPDTDTNFIEEPRFYTRATNANGVTTADAAVIFEYDNPCGCGACSCDGQGLPYTRLGQGVALDPRTGEVTLYPGSYDAANDVWSTGEFCGCGLPDRVKVRYLAGDDDCKWDEITARLAAAELGKPICGCQGANRDLYQWQFDLARAAGASDEQYDISDGDLDNPFGTRRGQVYAWRRVNRLALVRGFAL